DRASPGMRLRSVSRTESRGLSCGQKAPRSTRNHFKAWKGGLSRGRLAYFKEEKMTLYRWSQTAAADATADSTINWAEGQPPSSVNDSARAMMAATAKYRDDIAGAIVTGGTSTAYTVSSYQVFDSLAHLG